MTRITRVSSGDSVRVDRVALSATIIGPFLDWRGREARPWGRLSHGAPRTSGPRLTSFLKIEELLEPVRSPDQKVVCLRFVTARRHRYLERECRPDTAYFQAPKAPVCAYPTAPRARS